MFYCVAHKRAGSPAQPGHGHRRSRPSARVAAEAVQLERVPHAARGAVRPAKDWWPPTGHQPRPASTGDRRMQRIARVRSCTRAGTTLRKKLHGRSPLTVKPPPSCGAAATGSSAILDCGETQRQGRRRSNNNNLLLGRHSRQCQVAQAVATSNDAQRRACYIFQLLVCVRRDSVDGRGLPFLADYRFFSSAADSWSDRNPTATPN